MDAHEAELFSSLEWIAEQQEKYPGGNWSATIAEVEWKAW